jgi:lauroyl/myristoyl acyltransferase
MSGMNPIAPMESRLTRHLTSELKRQRFDRAKRFVDDIVRHGEGGDAAHRANARWLKFLCSRTAAQSDTWPKHVDLLLEFAAAFGLPPAERRRFIALSWMGQLWRVACFRDLMKGPPELVARLTQVTGWEHFERCRRDGAGLMILPVHGHFSRLVQPYLRHRGHDGLSVGLTTGSLEARGFATTAAKQFELARQLHAAKHVLARGGIAFNLPDAFWNLDNSRSVEFFGRQRWIATGFAELALTTGAHVLPISYRFSPRGFFVLEFGAPFHVLGPQSSQDERVDALVAQYASFLRDEWRRYPWNIQWTHLQQYCQLPAGDPGTPGERASGPPPSEARLGGFDEQFAR